MVVGEDYQRIDRIVGRLDFGSPLFEVLILLGGRGAHLE
jgi:hypothetical protein